MNKAVRGRIFQFLEKDGTSTKTCLVISADTRQTDKLISILMLGTKDSGDAIPVGDGSFVHCGLVTYCDRKRLGDPIAEVDEQSMAMIEDGIRLALGLKPEIDYETMYNNLLAKITER